MKSSKIVAIYALITLALVVQSGKLFGQDRGAESASLASQLAGSYNKALQRYQAKDRPGARNIVEQELLAVNKSFYLTYYLSALLDSAVTDKPEAEKSKFMVQDVDNYFYWKQNSGWKKYLKINPNSDVKEEAILYNLRAMAKRTLGEYKGAIEDSTRSIILATRIGDPLLISGGYHHRGVSKEYQGDLAGAEKDQLEALKHDPTYWWPYKSLLFLYSDRKEADKCFEVLYKMVELDPDGVYYLQLEKELQWLRSDPRWSEITERTEALY
jgi:tetratricopeptide (TPR) repeat protein